MNSKPTFLWHDYETFGAHPQFDRPAQFAAIRTNVDLEPVGDPINWYCQPARDVYPHPVASLITGITPQQAQKLGMAEAEFAKNIHTEMMKPATCSVGYNSIRFDDEFSRNLFYRNFFDPYEREYKNNNSRWDLIDLARMCYALRPEGIEWPCHESGSPSFRLEHLSAANNIAHEGAHEALSDVMATIGFARLIKTLQPRLYEWALTMRNQHQVMQLLSPASPKPVLHTTSRIPATRGCTTLVLPLSVFPNREKSVIVYDLMVDPQPLLSLGADEISDRLFTAAKDMPEDVERIPLKTIHTNKVPMIAPPATLKGVDCGRIGLDPELCKQHAEIILKELPKVRDKIKQIFTPYQSDGDQDPDHMIYSGGFFSSTDRRLMDTIRRTEPEQLAKQDWPFKDPRLTEMLFRFRARNYPQTLSSAESENWQQQRLHRLEESSDERQLNSDGFAQALAEQRQTQQGNNHAQIILDKLETWANELTM